MPNAEQWVQKLRNLYLDGLDDVVASTESPIEAVMLWALICSCTGWGSIGTATASCYPTRDGLGDTTYPGGGSFDDWLEAVAVSEETMILVAAPVQTREAKYRLDLALLYKPAPGPLEPVWIDVECDGHDFHERTRQQAERDKARDRDLQALGWVVARFTGSEIVRDPLVAARRVWQLASDTFWLRNPEPPKGATQQRAEVE
jgi:hypothetical protein